MNYKMSGFGSDNKNSGNNHKGQGNNKVWIIIFGVLLCLTMAKACSA